MVKSRSDEIRKRIAQRRSSLNKHGKDPKRVLAIPGEEEYDFNQMFTYDGKGSNEETHPLFKKEVIFFKILASICLFLVIAILFRNHSAQFDSARTLVQKAMDKEFQFAVVTDWYETKFGKPLALMPFTEKNKESEKTDDFQYDVPASGRILENFEKNGQGVMIETGIGTKVEAINEGIITFAGVKEGLGKTVIIQHSDQTESWYGNLNEIKVNVYEYIDKGKQVGTVSSSGVEDKSKGSYYFAIKKGDDFIDPSQVIRFD